MAHWNYVEIMILATQPTMIIPALYLVKRYYETKVREYLLWSVIFFQLTLNGILEIVIDLYLHEAIQPSVMLFILISGLKTTNLRLAGLPILLIALRWIGMNKWIRRVYFVYILVIFTLVIFDFYLIHAFWRITFNEPNWVSNLLGDFLPDRFAGGYRDKIAAGNIGWGIFELLIVVFYIDMVWKLTFTVLLIQTQRDVLPEIKTAFRLWLLIMVFTLIYSLIGILGLEGIISIDEENALLVNSIMITCTVISNFTILFLLFKYPKALVATRAMEERVREMYSKLEIVKSESTPTLNEYIDYLEAAQKQRSGG